MSMSSSLSQTYRTMTVKARMNSVREETFEGRQYVVVPLVALVEGVVHGANSEKPELVRASALAKAPQCWNGRPAVMNHPEVAGEYVSANSPSILEDWSFGMIFNSAVKGKELQMEAWLDVAKAEEKGGEFLSTLERARNGEAIEVSTGLYTEIDEDAEGTFKVNGKSKEYKGEWMTILPDHLALLSDGVLGACSIADGCGTRVQVHAAPKVEAITDIVDLHANCAGDKACSCGGGQMAETTEETPATRLSKALDGAKAMVLKAFTGGGNAEDEQGNQEGGQEAGERQEDAGQGSADGEEVTPEAVPGEEAEGRALSSILTHSVAPNLVFSDVEKQVRSALRRRAGIGSWYCILITQTHVVYTAESYGYYYSPSYIGDGTYQLAYDIDADGNVTFSGEPEAVNVITKIVPVMTAGGALNVNQQPEVEPMADAANAADTNVASASGAATVAGGGGVDNISTQAAPAPKVHTVESYLAEAPAGVKEMLQEGMRLQAAKKDNLIKGILANASNKFSEDVLKGFDTTTLEGIAALANVQIDYSGQAPAGIERVNANASDGFVPAPDVFARPAANTTPA